jgi:hypothetical protein
MKGRRASRRRAAVLVATVLTVASSAAGDRTRRLTSLRTRVGVGAAEFLGTSDDPAERLRGFERLGQIGTPRALSRLIRALEPGGAARTAEERLLIVRALAAHTEDPTARRALSRVLGGHSAPSPTDAPSALDDVAERTAALALAKAGTSDAVATLGKALEGAGRAAGAARAALVAHPPSDLAPLLAAARLPSVALAETLDELGDQRSFDALRDLVRQGPSDVSAVAAVALTHLGDFETVELSRRWVKGKEPDVLRVAGARILASARVPEAPRAVAALFHDERTTSAAIELALEAPSPALVPELARRLRGAEGTRAEDLVAAIGRAGGKEALAVLAHLLDEPALGVLAAYQIARTPGGAAAAILTGRLAGTTTRRLAAEAATARRVLLGETIDGLGPALESLLRSRDAADRAAGALGSAVLAPDRIEGFVASKDEGVVVAAASALLLAEPDVVARVAERALEPSRGVARTALALALAVPEAAARVPTTVLRALADEGGSAAPLAVMALCARDPESERERVDDLLASSDPFLRAHAALGLGASPAADAGGRLEAAYRLEPDARVRAAIVRGLSFRAEPSRRRVLALARDLDPDADVRGVAALAWSGAAPRVVASGGGLLWLPVSASGTEQRAAATVAVAVPGGLVLPAATLPDGLVVLSGLPRGKVALRVAPAEDHDNHSERGTGWPREKQR